MRRDIVEVFDRMIAEVPEDHSFSQLLLRYKNGLAYQAPESVWSWAQFKIGPAMEDLVSQVPHPPWADKVRRIWVGEDEPS